MTSTARRPGKLMPDAQALADASMTSEAAFQVRVVALLKRLGWTVYHTHDSRRSEAGFPDLICVRGRRLFAIELKTARGRVTDAQMAWLRALNEVTQVNAFILRPAADWSEFERLVA